MKEMKWRQITVCYREVASANEKSMKRTANWLFFFFFNKNWDKVQPSVLGFIDIIRQESKLLLCESRQSSMLMSGNTNLYCFKTVCGASQFLQYFCHS